MSQMSRESHHSPGFNPEAKEPAAAAAQLGGTLDLVDNILYLKIPNFEFLNTRLWKGNSLILMNDTIDFRMCIYL